MNEKKLLLAPSGQQTPKLRFDPAYSSSGRNHESGCKQVETFEYDLENNDDNIGDVQNAVTVQEFDMPKMDDQSPEGLF